MTISIVSNPDAMTSDDFAAELKDKRNVFIMSTSALDKIREYAELFSSREIDGYFIGSGAFGINASKTPEMTGKYTGNLGEKQKNQLYDLTQNEQLIRSKLGQTIPDAASLNLIGMTEDSGGTIFPDDSSQTSAFIAEVKNRIRQQLRKEDEWLLDTLKPDEFPGANLRPIQEHLLGGVNSMMNILYDVADEMGIDTLRYEDTAHISFQSPQRYQNGQKAAFSIESKSYGRLLSRAEYEKEKHNFDAITYNAIQVPDGQKEPHKSLYYLKRDGLFTKREDAPQASHYKLDAASYLSGIAGTRHINGDGTAREPKIGLVSPKTFEHGKDPLNGYDAVILEPAYKDENNNGTLTDKNLAMVLRFTVHASISPQQKYIILDNRNKDMYGTKQPFNEVIKIFRNASISEHRSFGELPFLVANTDKEMEEHLQLVKRVTQRLPKIYNQPDTSKQRRIDTLPDDGVYTVFVAGGHGNNSKQDRDDGFSLGYMCARNGYRIVTGAGSIDGSMGSVHTGFIQYHLDRIASGKSKIPATLRKVLESPEYRDPAGKISAETLITKNPALIDSLADSGAIPRDMFYGYSIKSLLKLESVTGEAPPGIKYFETGNLAERIHHMLQAGTKVIMPGSTGTDEELTEAIAQHLRAKKASNDYSPFSDGTPKDAGVIVVYNPRNIYGTILRHFDLIDDKGRTTKTAREHNIIIVNSSEKLHDSIDKTKSWQKSVAESPQSTGAAQRL